MTTARILPQPVNHVTPKARPLTTGRPRPAAPQPHATPLGLLATFRALRSNPITAFAEKAYEESILRVGRFRDIVLVNDPNEIERVLLSNTTSYRKSEQQQRKLRPALGEGLLTAEGPAW